MKKLLLSLGLVAGFGSLNAQVICNQISPNAVAYNFTQTSGWDLDMSAPGTYVVDTLAVSTDTLGCTSVAGVAGKVALIYRGSCNFTVKAQNAEAAGAVAVIIVNNVATAPIVMGSGATTTTVSIPVVMISQADGAALRATMAGGPVVMFIGNKTGYFGDDCSIFDNKVLRANFGSKPLALAQNASEFSFSPGAWVYNNGQNAQSAVTVNVAIDRDGSNVYNQTSAAASIPVGDSAWFTTPAYSAASYTAGKYKVTYTVDLGSNTDEALIDNTSINYFSLDPTLWSLARLDTTGGAMVAKDGYYRAATLPNTSFETCISFKDANANRVAMDGVYFGGMTVATADTATVNLDGFEVTWTLYTWNDADKTIAAGTFNSISEVATGSYIYPDPADAMFQKTVFMPVTNVVGQAGATTYRFVNNQQYLLCINNYAPKVYMAYSTEDYYDLLIDGPIGAAAGDDMIRFPLRNDETTWTNGGFGIAPSVALHTGTNLSVEETTIEASAYPNPTKDVITVKVNASGDATLKVTDLAGRTVSNENIKIENGQFTANTTGFTSGTYVFHVDYANGTTSRFNVVVTK